MLRTLAFLDVDLCTTLIVYLLARSWDLPGTWLTPNIVYIVKQRRKRKRPGTSFHHTYDDTNKGPVVYRSYVLGQIFYLHDNGILSGRGKATMKNTKRIPVPEDTASCGNFA